MSYQYADYKASTLTERGQVQLFATLKKARDACRLAGCVRADHILPSGDGWESLAILDRLVELGELCEVTGPTTPGQHRIFMLA